MSPQLKNVKSETRPLSTRRSNTTSNVFNNSSSQILAFSPHGFSSRPKTCVRSGSMKNSVCQTNSPTRIGTKTTLINHAKTTLRSFARPSTSIYSIFSNSKKK
eukprot:TRINITY_DN18795_c0_g2_i2.p1 TRINITY_DN18795_c0_g2~~TRINITY_DN18795_c0_g2_i2.p1  ORF type:complete len:103 (-),score=9.62 TRINITY_DN18795_c0_g2_i2:256-564(-)